MAVRDEEQERALGHEQQAALNMDAVLSRHNEVARLEEPDDAGTQLYHLLHDALSWCDRERVDFDAVLGNVRADLNA